MAETDDLIERLKKETDPLSRGKILRFLKREKQFKSKKLAQILDLIPSYISHLLRLNNLPEIITDGYYSKTISLSHLFIISRLKNHETMLSMYEQVLENGLTVLQTEYLVREINHSVKTEGRYLTHDAVESTIDEIKKKYSDKLSPKIIQSRTGSKLIIELKGSPKDTLPTLNRVLSDLRRT